MSHYLALAFQSLMGPVETESIWDSLGLLLKGMGGVLLVMLLIFIVIVVLNKAFSRPDPEKKDEDQKR